MCSNLFIACSNVFKHVQTCSKLVQMCSNLFKTCSNVFKCVQKCSNMFRLAQNLFKCYQRCSNVFKLVQNLFKCGQMFSNVFKLVPPGTLQAYPLTSWNPDQLADLTSPFWSCYNSLGKVDQESLRGFLKELSSEPHIAAGRRDK